MLRVTVVNLTKLKPLLEGVTSGLVGTRSLTSGIPSWSGPVMSRNVPALLGDRWGDGLQFQQIRAYGSPFTVNTNSVKWLRRRRKALEQRLELPNPSSPVINQRAPLPPGNEGRYPSDLFEIPQPRDFAKEEKEQEGVVAEINRQLQTNETGRLFAVIHVQGKQFKVTPEDILIVQGYWAPNIGDRLRFHKVMLLGGTDFTLVGKPLLDHHQIRVEGTVIEKTLSYTKLYFRLKKRKNYRRLRFIKDPYTMIRINLIEILTPLEMPKAIEEKEAKTIEGDFNVAAKVAV